MVFYRSIEPGKSSFYNVLSSLLAASSLLLSIRQFFLSEDGLKHRSFTLSKSIIRCYIRSGAFPIVASGGSKDVEMPSGD